MKDIIIGIIIMIMSILGFKKMLIFEKDRHDEYLKNEIEKTKLIIEELKK